MQELRLTALIGTTDAVENPMAWLISCCTAHTVADCPVTNRSPASIGLLSSSLLRALHASLYSNPMGCSRSSCECMSLGLGNVSPTSGPLSGREPCQQTQIPHVDGKSLIAHFLDSLYMSGCTKFRADPLLASSWPREFVRPARGRQLRSSLWKAAITVMALSDDRTCQDSRVDSMRNRRMRFSSICRMVT